MFVIGFVNVFASRKKAKEVENLLRAVKFVVPFKWFIIVILFLTLLTAAFNAIEPLLLKIIFDNLSSSKILNSIITGIILLLSAGLLRDAASNVSNWLTWKTRLNIQYSLLSAAISKLHRLPQEMQRNEGVGALMTRLDRGITGFMNALNELSFNLLPAIAYLIISLIIMFQLDWRLTLLVIFFTPIPAIIAAFAAPIQTKRELSLLEKWVKIYSRFNEVLSGIVTVRSFAMEDEEKKRFLNSVKNANNIVENGVNYDSRISFLQNTTITLARISAIAAGGYLIINNEATTGTLIAFLGYIGGLFGPVQGLTGIYKTLRTAKVSLDQIFAILDNKDETGDLPDAVKPDYIAGEIEFSNMHFSYNYESGYVLENINLQVKPGEKIALVGPSGAGKTTLVSLLMRFYNPIIGNIKLDGIDIAKIKQKWLRKNIGVVLQDALLFNDSIKNNIAYGKPDASLKEIQDAAIAANAHDFIMKLENGYETNIGERGGRLSFGERQRIAIARAILKDSPILILDEATSALDTENESQIQEALERLLKNKTAFIIAHRLSTIVKSDRIVVLKEGKIAEIGTHTELMHLGGYYSTLVNKQLKGFQ